MVATEILKYTEMRKSVWELTKEWETGLYVMPKIQRGLVWTNSQKSLLIHSFLIGIKMGDIIADDKDDKINIFDAQQRTNAATTFLKDGFRLEDNTPDVRGIKIAGKVFSELPEEFQKKIENTMLNIVRYEELTEEQRDDLFIRYNNGTDLDAMERNKGIAGTQVITQITPIFDGEFIKNCIGVGEKKEKYRLNVAWQMMMLVDSEFKGRDLGKGSINQFSEKVKQGEVETDVISKTLDVVNYLNEAIPVKESFLSKKTEVPMLFVAASKALNDDVPAVKFGGWAQNYFAKAIENPNYVEAKRGGSAKKTQVENRIAVILDEYEQNINDAPDYTKPTTNRRGAPKKNQPKAS